MIHNELSALYLENQRNEVFLLKEIQRKLKEFEITKEDPLIDVAGGMGFPFLDLERLGYNIQYSDASRRAKKNGRKRCTKSRKSSFARMERLGRKSWKKQIQVCCLHRTITTLLY
jgi:hypothetical protein